MYNLCSWALLSLSEGNKELMVQNNEKGLTPYGREVYCIYNARAPENFEISPCRFDAIVLSHQ